MQTVEKELNIACGFNIECGFKEAVARERWSDKERRCRAAKMPRLTASTLPALPEAVEVRLDRQWGELAEKYRGALRGRRENSCATRLIGRERFQQLESAYVDLWAARRDSGIEGLQAWLVELAPVAAESVAAWLAPRSMRRREVLRQELGFELTAMAKAEGERMGRVAAGVARLLGGPRQPVCAREAA